MFCEHGGETGSHGRAHHGRSCWESLASVLSCTSQLGTHSPCVADLWWPGGPLPSMTLFLPTSITSWALVEKIFSLTFCDAFAEFCWLMWDKMGDFSAEVATWENRSLSHVICQALLLHAQSIFNRVTFRVAPHLQWHSPRWFPPALPA